MLLSANVRNFAARVHHQMSAMLHCRSRNDQTKTWNQGTLIRTYITSMLGSIFRNISFSINVFKIFCVNPPIQPGTSPSRRLDPALRRCLSSQLGLPL
jgi:hypothetical protein